MPISVPEPVEERGKKDARRHRDKQKEILKERLPELIGNEDIITGKRNRIVKIRIRSLDIPHFRPAQEEEGGGIGQGDGREGDPIGQRPVPGAGGAGGDESGDHMIDTEVDLSEAIEMMLEDLGLPNLQPKNVKEFMVSLGINFEGRDKIGPRPLMDNKATAKEGIKRFWHFLRHLQKESGRDELACYDALVKTKGIINDALKLLADVNFRAVSTEIVPFPIVYHDDERYHRIEEAEAPQSQAVVIAMMDVSGSMDDMKKYLARSMLFWIVEFLRVTYKQLEVRFIIHDSEAKLVDEHDFFHTNESGGTTSSSAYKLAGELIDSEYPTSEWNVYCFHFSDGDDSSPAAAILEVINLIDRGINLFGYGEVDSPKLGLGGDRHLLKMFSADLPNVMNSNDDGTFMVVGKADYPFLGMRVVSKEDILPSIKQFLRKERWAYDE